MNNQALITKYIVLQSDLGINDNLFGGRLLYLLDNAAAVFATQSADNVFVTYGMEGMKFIHPCKQGDVLEFYGAITNTTSSGLEIEISVYDTDVHEGTKNLVFTTKVVMVAVNKRGVKTPLKMVTKDENK